MQVGHGAVDDTLETNSDLDCAFRGMPTNVRRKPIV